MEDETMLDFIKKIDVKKTGIFAAGVAFGTAGIKILSSKDQRKYTQIAQQQFLELKKA